MSETVLNIEPHGCVSLAAPSTSAEAAQQFLLCVGVSIAFGAAPVQLAHWLPGMHLHLRATPAAWAEASKRPLLVDEVWPVVAQKLAAWVAQPADAEVLRILTPWVDLVFAPEVYAFHWLPPIFTFNRAWPQMQARTWMAGPPGTANG